MKQHKSHLLIKSNTLLGLENLYIFFVFKECDIFPG